MRHNRLEQLVLAIGGAAILGSLAVSLPTGSQPELVEIIAQVMLIAVLFTGVRYGRRGGAIAASIAAIVYVGMRVPALTPYSPSGTVVLMLALRVVAFGLVGIVGAETSRQLQYSFARLEGGSALDEWSRVFNEKYFMRELEQALGRAQRYSEPFTTVVLSLSPSLFADLKPSRQRTLVRTLSGNLRADIRMVDEVARLNDGRFVVLLPHTPKEGGAVVSTRLGALTRLTLGARDEAVSVRDLSAPEDEAALRALLDELTASAAEAQAESVS